MADRVLLLLAGLMCDDTVWAHQREALADLADVRIMSFPGFDSITAMAQTVLEQAPPRFALAGHSMGGRVALEVMRLAPERVERLALLNTGAHPPLPDEPEKRGALVELGRTEDMAAVANRWLPPMMKPGRLDADPTLAAELKAMVERGTPESFAAQTRALLTRPDATPVLSAIRCPTMLLSGRQDGFSPLARHAAMQALIPDSVLVAIEDAGHMAPVEQPQAVANALRVWLTMPHEQSKSHSEEIAHG